MVDYTTLNSTNGVMPVYAEPLTGWEKSGLTGLATATGLQGGLGSGSVNAMNSMLSDPQSYAQQFVNPQATQYMTSAGDYTGRGAAPITMQQVQEAANPYSNALTNRLTEAGERAKAALSASLGGRGGRSFGDMSTGVRQGELDKEMLSKGNDIQYQTFEDAKKFLQEQRGREMTAGGQYGNLASGAQGLTTSGMNAGLTTIGAASDLGQRTRENTLENFQRQAKAGQYVREYNQGVNDVVAGQLSGQQSFDQNQLSNIMELLKAYQSGTSSTTSPTTSTAQKIGSGVGVLGTGIAQYEQGQNNLLNDINSSISLNPNLF